ncbi:hypothetical protein BGX26_012435 [Mortierella sp. AD094]|nr:hypothetical protein BGX26_012435 [Mortierella sp. AD094]
MNPTLDSPMDLLEVRSMVARYLDPTSSANCARVCRAWNPLFQPLAWKEVFYDQASRRRGLNPEVLERRKHFIHSLDVSGRSHSDIPSIWFTNLSSLKVAIQTQNIDVNVQRSLTALILGAPGSARDCLRLGSDVLSYLVFNRLQMV